MYNVNDECYMEIKSEESVELPDDLDLSLPFLAYGFFKPRQLSYHLIRGYVYNKPEHTIINNVLNHINGMPILDYKIRDDLEIDAYYMEFKKGKKAKKAYKTISLTKNKKIYKWDVIQVKNKEGEYEPMNVLMNAAKKSFPIYTYKWNSYDWRNDPIYQKTLDYVDENIARFKIYFNNDYDSNDPHLFMRFIDVQSVYRTLWTAIDRFLTFRYGDFQQFNVRKWADEDFFKEALEENYDALFQQEFYESNDSEGKVDRRNNDWSATIFSARNLDDYDLHPLKSTCSAMYYYTLRNNVVHAGKMLPNEVNMVLNALLGLTEIFRHSIDVVSKKKY